MENTGIKADSFLKFTTPSSAPQLPERGGYSSGIISRRDTLERGRHRARGGASRDCCLVLSLRSPLVKRAGLGVRTDSLSSPIPLIPILSSLGRNQGARTMSTSAQRASVHEIDTQLSIIHPSTHPSAMLAVRKECFSRWRKKIFKNRQLVSPKCNQGGLFTDFTFSTCSSDQIPVNQTKSLKICRHASAQPSHRSHSSHSSHAFRVVVLTIPSVQLQALFAIIGRIHGVAWAAGLAIVSLLKASPMAGSRRRDGCIARIVSNAPIDTPPFRELRAQRQGIH